MRRVASTLMTTVLLLAAQSACDATAGYPKDTPQGLDMGWNA